MSDRSALERALALKESEIAEAIGRLRDLAPRETFNEVYELTARLREAQTLVGCLRRLTRGRSVRALHDAFGAPGDFGYETPLGAALWDAYREGGPQ